MDIVIDSPHSRDIERYSLVLSNHLNYGLPNRVPDGKLIEYVEAHGGTSVRAKSQYSIL